MFSTVLRSSTRLAARVTPARSLSTLVASKAAFSVPRTASACTASSVSRLAARAFSSAQSLAYEERRPRSPRPEQSEPSSAVYVGNMPWNMTKEEVIETFSEFGTIESVRIRKSFSFSSFLFFRDFLEEFQSFFFLTPLSWVFLFVLFLFLTFFFNENLPLLSTETHADGRPRGFCHITFASEQQATAAVASAREEPIHVTGRDLVVDYAKLPANTYTKVEPNNKVYFQRFVGSESELRNLLGEFSDSVVSIFYSAFLPFFVCIKLWLLKVVARLFS